MVYWPCVLMINTNAIFFSHKQLQFFLSACIRDFFYWTPHSIPTTPQATTVVAVLTDFMQIKNICTSYACFYVRHINQWLGSEMPTQYLSPKLLPTVEKIFTCRKGLKLCGYRLTASLVKP